LGFGKRRSPAVRDSTAGGLSCRERERGLALVEFALVVPFLLILIVGIIDFGFLFNDVISVRQGARDGGRQAAVGKFGSDPNCELFLSTPASISEKNLMCLTKSRDDVSDKKTRVRVIVGDGSSGSAYSVGKPIAICEQYEMRSLTRVLPVLSGRVFTTRTVFRVETVAPGFAPGLGTVVVSEDPLPNEAWKCAPPSSVS
jgi:TadE-like protein